MRIGPSNGTTRPLREEREIDRQTERDRMKHTGRMIGADKQEVTRRMKAQTAHFSRFL